MNQQISRVALRAFILFWIFLCLVRVAVSFADNSLLPKELADWKASQETDDDAAVIGFLIFVLPLMAALIASLAGLFMFKKWGAWLYLALSLLGSLSMLIEPIVESGLSACFSELLSCLAGVIIGVAFFSKALEPDEPSS